MPFPVVLDACVLAPYPLCDVLLRFADEGTYRPLWSEDIIAETRRTMVNRLGVSEERADYRIGQMRGAFIDAEVTGYHDLIGAMNNDPKDRHVLAAAVRARAEVIVTANVRDFPDDALSPYQIRLLHPDDFLLDQLDLYEGATWSVIQGMVDDYGYPAHYILDALVRAAPNFAAEARRLFPPE